MEFEQVLFSRRSVRRFDSSREITQEQLRKIIEAGIYAPSACNFQAWKFIVIRKAENKRRLRYDLIDRAPCGILVTYRNDLLVTGRKHKDYVQSAAAAIENMLLEIENLGLAGCWICNLPRQGTMRRAFAIPGNFDVIACIALGYPAEDINTTEQMLYHYGGEESARKRTRKYGFEQAVCYERFSVCRGDCTAQALPWVEKVLFTLGRKKRLRLPTITIRRKKQ